MNKTIDVNAIFQEACALKEDARKSPESSVKFKEASKLFDQAGTLTRTWINDQTDPSMKIYGYALSSYYFYEHNDCLASYHYDRREIDCTIDYIDKAQKWINTALDFISQAQGQISFNPNILSELLERKEIWKYYKENDAVFRTVALARKEYDNEQYLDALDLYRNAAKTAEALVNRLQSNTTTSILKIQRISKGNYVGIMANVSFMFIKIIEKKLYQSSIDDTKHTYQLEIKLLEHLLKAYKSSSIAFEENPEVNQYENASTELIKNIEEFLRKKKHLWKDIYIDFEKDDVVKQMMKKIDHKKFKKVENDLVSDNKAVKLWMIGSFFILLFVIIISSLCLVANIIKSIWIFMTIIFAAEVFLLIIGGLVARTIGDLTEKGFLELIRIVFANQFKLFRLLNKNNPPNDPQ